MVAGYALLQNYPLSSVSPPQTVLQYTVHLYCLCSGLLCAELFITSLWCRVKLENFVCILPGLSSIKILWNWSLLISVYVCDFYVSLNDLLIFQLFQSSVKQPTQFPGPKFTTFQNESSVIQLDIKALKEQNKCTKEEVSLWMLLPWWRSAPASPVNVSECLRFAEIKKSNHQNDLAAILTHRLSQLLTATVAYLRM